MAPIISRISSLGGGGTGGFTFGKRRTFATSDQGPPPVLAYSLTTQQNFNSSNSYDFNLTSNVNDLSKAVTVMMWANISSSQSEGGGNQSGVIWNWQPPGVSLQYEGPGMGFTKPGYQFYHYFAGVSNDNNINVNVQGNTWVHLVWQRNSNNQVRAWFNGNALSNYTSQTGVSVSSLNSTHRLGYSIGQYTYSMNGSITDLFIYKNECYFSNTISIPTRGGGAPF